MATVSVPRFRQECLNCGFLLRFTYQYCPECGVERLDNTTVEKYDEKTIITRYFSCGHEYERIVELLAKEHHNVMSIRTLKNRLKEYNLKRCNVVYDEREVRQRISEILNGPGCMGGYRSIWHTLRMEGKQVPRLVVERLLKELDPEGCVLRRAKRLRRRKFSSPGPNHCWHVDGYDKLKPYGFPIHGAIDAWSRKMMWLKVARSNNHPAIPASFYLECVAQHNGCPEIVRTDNGTENGILALMQCMLRNDPKAHVYGRSTGNQRIEGWWSYLRRNRTTWWMNFFKDLTETGEFSPGNEIEKECLWFSFSGVIQQDLDFVTEHWNTHTIRQSSCDTISGKPDELYTLPENNGGENKLHSVSAADIQFVSENLLLFDEEPNIYQEYFEYVSSVMNFEKPGNWRDALSLYKDLLHVFEQNQ